MSGIVPQQEIWNCETCRKIPSMLHKIQDEVMSLRLVVTDLVKQNADILKLVKSLNEENSTLKTILKEKDKQNISPSQDPDSVSNVKLNDCKTQRETCKPVNVIKICMIHQKCYCLEMPQYVMSAQLYQGYR